MLYNIYNYFNQKSTQPNIIYTKQNLKVHIKERSTESKPKIHEESPCYDQYSMVSDELYKYLYDPKQQTIHGTVIQQ